MNMFEYTLTIQEIEQATTLLKTEQILRKVIEASDIMRTGYYYRNNNIPLTEEILNYKLCQKALNHRNGKGKLPQFITEGIDIGVNKLIMKFITNSKETTYEQLADLLEFRDNLHFQKRLNPTEFTKLTEIIGDNPLPTVFMYNLSLSNEYDYLWSKLHIPSTTKERTIPVSLYLTSYGDGGKVLFFIEDLKRKLGYKPYTVIDELLKDFYSKIEIKHEAHVEEMDEMLKGYTETMENIKARINT